MHIAGLNKDSIISLFIHIPLSLMQITTSLSFLEHEKVIKSPLLVNFMALLKIFVNTIFMVGTST